MILNKLITYLTVRVHTALKISKKRTQSQCTGLLRHSKLVHLDGKKTVLFYEKFNAEFNELSLFLKATGTGQKLLKLKYCGKTPIGVVGRLRVKRQVKTLQGVLKEGFLY